MVPSVSSVLFQGRQPSGAGAPVPSWCALQTDEVNGFLTEGVAVDGKDKCCLADLSFPRAAIKSVCPVTTSLDSASSIPTMSESMVAKLQATVPGVQIVGPMTDDQYVKMADGKMVLVKQKPCPVRIALLTMWGPGLMDPVSYAVLMHRVLVKQKPCPVKRALHTMWGPGLMDPAYAVLMGKEDAVILGSPTLPALGINVYGSLALYPRKRNLSVQGVESPNSKEGRRVTITVAAIAAK